MNELVCANFRSLIESPPYYTGLGLGYAVKGSLQTYELCKGVSQQILENRVVKKVIEIFDENISNAISGNMVWRQIRNRGIILPIMTIIGLARFHQRIGELIERRLPLLADLHWLTWTLITPPINMLFKVSLLPLKIMNLPYKIVFPLIMKLGSINLSHLRAAALPTAKYLAPVSAYFLLRPIYEATCSEYERKFLEKGGQPIDYSAAFKNGIKEVMKSYGQHHFNELKCESRQAFTCNNNSKDGFLNLLQNRR